MQGAVLSLQARQIENIVKSVHFLSQEAKDHQKWEEVQNNGTSLYFINGHVYKIKC